MTGQPKQAKCSTCGRAIIWSHSPSDARLPLDARPVSVYTLGWAAEPLDGDTPRATRLEREPGAEPLYISHFLTCPEAAQHSRARAR